jgi:hypothetical protein
MKQLISIFILCLGVKGLSQQPVFINGGAEIYSVNVNDCTYRFVGKSIGPQFNDIAFTPDGKLWGISGGELFQIDTANAVATFIGNSIAADGVSLVALNDSILLGEDLDSLWGINIRTSQNYNMGYIGYAAAGDLSWLGNDLYTTSYNQLIKIVLNSNFSAILISTPVNSIDNPIPLCDGLATVSVNGQASLIGFCQGGTYNISPIDGTFQLICDLDADGAASISYPSALPVNLLNFYYVLLNQSVELEWQTATEINSSYFLIQRSADGTNFSSIGKQPAANNSSTLKQYIFTDNNPLNTNYYRLKEVDLNGNSTYSNTLLVKLTQAQNLTILQNPVQNSLQVQLNNGNAQTSSLTIFDLLGRRFKSLTVPNGLQTINVSSLPSGTYIIQLITSDGEICNERFIKAK